MKNFKNTAEAYRYLYKFDCVEIKEIIQWADSIIEESENGIPAKMAEQVMTDLNLAAHCCKSTTICNSTAQFCG